MPIPIMFNYVSTHNIIKAGIASCVPALPHSSRLYVIHHNLANNRPFYIGTADNVRNRFAPRLATVRELGFRNNEILNISIAVVQIFVNGAASPPHNTGIAANIDVEHLLIRLYMNQGNGVRNIGKIAPFVNGHGQALNCTLFNPANWGHFIPANTNIAAGAAV